MRSARLLALALLATAPLLARAADGPHYDGDYCSNCHVGHNSPGAGLTKVGGNFNLCDSCHATSSNFGFNSWTTATQATPGAAGRSHRWDATASNLDATPPSASSPDPGEAAMGKRLDGGKLMCSTCHDQHQGDSFPVSGRGTQHVSPIAQTAGTGTGGVAFSGTVGSSAAARGYVLDIVTPGAAGTATFRVSNDNETSWFGCTAPATYTYVAWTGANACQTGGNVPLNDGANVAVSFTGAGAGAFLAGDQWSFYVAYPFLRADNTDAKMCVTCHKDRDQHWQDAEGGVANAVPGGKLTSVTLGVTKFSHPVGQALNQDGRTNGLAAILDANGMVQAVSTDPNKTNDLVLGTAGIVTCLSCHHPHNADSNSLSVDPR